jgi:hypothetical protein
MAVDWGAALATLAAPAIAFGIAEWDKRRARLIAFFSQRAEFTAPLPDGGTVTAVLHTIILRNRGSSPVTNVRLHHHQLPAFSIRPQHVQRQVEGTDIVLPQVLPNEVVEVSYLYVAPTTPQQVHAGIRSDQGFARGIPVTLQRRLPRWAQWTVRAVLLIGLGTVGFWAARFVRYLLPLVLAG